MSGASATSGGSASPPRAGRLALLALLTYALLAAWQLRVALAPGQVLGASAFVVREGPFEPGLRERAPTQSELPADSAKQFTPWLLYAARHLQQDGELPLWKSTAFCGAPLVGNGQSALFFPPRLLAVLLGAPAWVHVAMAWLRLVLAAFGAFLLLRHLGLRPLGAWLGGFVFGFGGFLIVFRFHPHADVAALLPWLLLAGDRLAQRPGARRVAALALVAGLQWLAGHPETALHSQLALALLVPLRAWSRRRRPEAPTLAVAIGALAVALLLGLCVAAIQLVPLIEYTLGSEAVFHRAFAQGLPAWSPWLPAAMLVAGLGLAAFALVRLRRGPRAAGPGLLLAFGVALGLAGATAGGPGGGAGGGFMLPLCADWFGGPLRYMGPPNYAEGNGAWVGAALVLAAAGLLFGSERGLVRVAACAAVTGLLAAAHVPQFLQLLRWLPLLGLADNGRLALLGLLGLAVLAGLGLDALGRPSRGAARLAAAVLAPALAAFGLLVAATQAGTIRSADAPVGAPPPLSVARFGLLPPTEAAAVRALEDRAADRATRPDLPQDDAHLEVLGFAATREPLRGVQLLYSSATLMAPTRWTPVDTASTLGGVLAGDAETAGWSRYVFRAEVPRDAVQPGEVPVRVRAVTMSRGVLVSDLFFAPDDGDTVLPFPARPAPGLGPSQLVLLGACLLLALAACAAQGRAARLLPPALAGVALLSLLPFGEEFAPTLSRELFYPPSAELARVREVLPDQRVLCMDNYALGPEVLTAFELPEVRGYDALTPPHVARLLRGALDWPTQVSPVEALPARPDPDLRLLGVMAVGEVLARAPSPAERLVAAPGVALPPPGDVLQVVHNPLALPRARLVSRAVLQADDEAAVELLRDDRFDAAGTGVLAEPGDLPPALLVTPRAASKPAIAQPPARIVVDRPDLVRVEVAPAAPALLLLADTHFPGWSARVDGVERPILRANVAFRAVAVAPGDRVVEFRYEPGSFALGRALTLAALALCALLLLRRPR